MDFTLAKYKHLLITLKNKIYIFQTFENFLEIPNKKTAVSRHDVDQRPHNDLKMATLEAEAGIVSTYYFRATSSVFKPEIVQRISDLGHEIGYHYENLSYVSKLHKGISREQLFELAIEDFEKNLEKFRRLVPIKTICMHGNPWSKYDNRELWTVYDYRNYGIIGEPYFDVDYNEVLYLTDTGRAWNTSRGNVRDKVQTEFNFNFKSTFDIIRALENDELPDKIMLNIHPQRWTDNPFTWTWELFSQKTKNIAKMALTSLRK